jgi:hypothetical protein
MIFRKSLAINLSRAALCALFASGTSLQAATVSYSNSIPASDAAGHGGLPTSAAFTLPEFNPALGTLQSVQVSFAVQYQGEVDIFNFSGSPQTAFTASSSVPITITAPSPGVPGLTASNSLMNASLTSSPPLNQFLGAVSNTTIPFAPLPANFASYEGIGNSNYTLAYSPGTYSGSTSAPGGTVFFGGDANSVGTASVVYTYNAVPEPSTLTLLGLGTVALAALARRKMRTRAA